MCPLALAARGGPPLKHLPTLPTHWLLAKQDIHIKFTPSTKIYRWISRPEREISILKTIGASDFTIVSIFIFQGLYISMLGIISGLILGILITLNLDPLINFIETLINRSLLDNYFINYFPYAFNFNQITLVLLSSFLLCFISSVWPSTRAAKLNPNEVLRHE